MTDKEKLEAIRAEIHRLVDVRGYDREMANDLFTFMDSLPNEPVSKRFAFKSIPRLLEMIEPTGRAKSYVTKLADAFDSEGYYTDAKIVRERLKIMNGEKVAMATMDEEPVSDELEKIVEEIVDPTVLNAYGVKEIANKLRKTMIEPVSEDLEEAIDTYLATYFGGEKEKQEWPFLKKMAIYFAQWHKQKDSIPVSEDLEEASKEWLRPQLDKSYANYGETKMMELTHFDGYTMLDAIEFGAKWQKAKDESTTEDLGEYINELSKQFPEVSFAKLSRIAVRVAKWQKENLWKHADGDDLPEIDREVIAILDYDFGHYKVVYAHRPNPNGWNGTNIDTGERSILSQ